MLYYLSKFLDSTYDFPGMGLFNYISFRSAMTFITSVFLSMIVGKRIINFLRKKQIGETIRDLGLEGQMSKKGTPTMGGIIIIIAIVIPCLLFGKLANTYLILMLITTLWLGAMGFADDYIKVFLKNKEGMHGKSKIIGQVALGLIVGCTLYLSPNAVIVDSSNTNIAEAKTAEAEVINNETPTTKYYKIFNSEPIKSTQTTIPFVKNNNFDYADLFGFLGEYKQIAAWLFFIVLCVFIVTAVSNGANLTDGLDGLAAGTSGTIGIAMGGLAYVSSNILMCNYLKVMYIPGSEELVIFAAAFIGALVGFLWYNSYPAQVFMGDTGSLTIGGIIAVFCIILHKELLLPILCGVFLVENLSVMLQVGYFKYTKKKYGEGRRILLMSPLHHHFQKKGIHESKIVTRFWIISIALAIFTIITLKIR